MNKDLLIPVGSLVAIIAIGFFGMRDIGNTMGKSLAAIYQKKAKQHTVKKEATEPAPEPVQ